ncbi:Hsp70 family protein [Gordonia sp. ABSL49_1]|uniref:Hsp70 family protein n=1 Tax=Gordonia sp. ABSL49_1 TaxID=2920941 RepID=UPI001F0EA4E8|nr:Hsp70 family protein [Gordonia sp. ABSL49_1]MCH5642201.1 Hsp70 family protein [Gordonia sp. ABSL49_1]
MSATDHQGSSITSPTSRDPDLIGASTSMGVSAGSGMIHVVLVTHDDVGRSEVESRVIDVDESDGLDTAGRVNAGVDLMLAAARDAELRVGPIGVTARTGSQRRRLRSRGSGKRRQVRLVPEEESTVAYLSETGQIDRFGSVVVVDAGDTGMSMYTVDPHNGRVSGLSRSEVMSGRKLDRALADAVSDGAAGTEVPRGRVGRSALLSACRTAKEEIVYGSAEPGASSVTLADGSGRLSLSASTVERTATPMVDKARKVLGKYISDAALNGGAPEAVVLVGGLANLPVIKGMADDSGLEVIRPASPELASATGAALLAQYNRVGVARLAFIGGRRDREWLSTTPLAVAGAILAAAMMTIYAVSSSLTGNNVPEPTPLPATSSVVSRPVGTSMPATTERTLTTTTTLPTTFVPVPPPTYTQPGVTDPPGWATTELTQATTQSTTTRTLSPFPLPSLPFPPNSTPPTIPPGLLPPGILPQTTKTPPPPPVSPLRQAPSRSATPPTGPTTPSTTPAR